VQAHQPQPFEKIPEVWGRRKWLALSVFALTAVAGGSLAFSLPSIYRATATVVVEQNRNSAANPGEIESRLQLISQEILSRARLEAIISSLRLYTVLRQRAPMEAAVGQMRRDIQTESKVQPTPNGIGATTAFAISYRGRDPEVVAKVANAIASFYLEEDRKIRDRQTSGTVRLLKTQLDEVKSNLQEKEQALGSFQDEHAGTLPQESEANLANLERVQGELRAATEERLRAVDRRNELLRQLDSADAAPTTAGAAPTNGRLERKREELADMRQRFSDKYPDVVRLKEEVAALEKEAAPAAAGPGPAAGSAGRTARLRESLQDVEGEISTLRSEESRLRAEVAERIRRLETAPRRQRGYQTIARDYQTTRDLYDSLRKRYEEAQLEDDKGGGTATSPLRILDSAIVPTAAVAPNRLLLLFATLVGALVMAAATAWAADWLDTSLHSAEDVRSFTRVPVLVSIPRIVTAGDRHARARRVWLAAAAVFLALGVVAQGVHRVARGNEALVLMMARGNHP
jgi:polysaccharide biosynthesis transport protein